MRKVKVGLVCQWVDPLDGESYRLLSSTPAAESNVEYYLQILKDGAWEASPFNGRGVAICLARKMHLDLNDFAGPVSYIAAYPNFSDLE